MRRVALSIRRKASRRARQLRGRALAASRSLASDALVLVGAGCVLYGVGLVWLPLSFVLGGAGAIAAGLALAPRRTKRAQDAG